jgi:hypothetical protein
VSISHTTAIVGADGANSTTGAAYVFTPVSPMRYGGLPALPGPIRTRDRTG